MRAIAVSNWQQPSEASTGDPEPSFNADDTLISLDPPWRRFLVHLVAVGAVLVYVAYLVYRGLYTLNPDAMVFSTLLYLAEVHGLVSLILFFHQAWNISGRRVVPPNPGLKVDVFITTYNEDVELLRQTVRAAIGIRYPHRTFVLDDGRRESVRAMAEELGCEYLTRADNRHAKAGNWNNAFQATNADLIATFDADHVPRPDFLDRTLGFFRDPRVAIVQVPQQYHNLDSVQHRVSWRRRRMYGEQDAFFDLVMPGKDHWNAAFFCGTGAVLRREALVPHGGIMTDTITEDLHTSIVLHSQGWKSVYLNEVLVTGLAPVDLKSLQTQRLRWAEGNLNVATFINPITASGLTAHQRVSYFASLYHWTIGLPKLIYYVAPPWMLWTGTFPIANYDRHFLSIYLAFLTSLIVSYAVVSRGRGRLLLDELFNMVSFFTLSRAVKRALFGRGSVVKFEVTSKRGSGTQDVRPVLPHLTLLAFSLLAVVWSLLGLGFGVTDDVFGAGTAMFWTLYNVALMVIVLRLGARPAEKRGSGRFRAEFPVEPADDPSGVMGVTADISDSGCSLLWPNPLPLGTRRRWRVHFGPRTVEWLGVVRTEQPAEDDGWYRYGIQFEDLTAADVDLINDSIFALVVPQLFSTLSTPPRVLALGRQLRRWIDHRLRLRRRRQPVRIPVRLQQAGISVVATARDVSRSGVRVLSPVSVPVGSTLRLTMAVPGGHWTGDVVVARVVSHPSRPGFETWTLGLRFERPQAERDLERFEQETAA